MPHAAVRLVTLRRGTSLGRIGVVTPRCIMHQAPQARIAARFAGTSDSSTKYAPFAVQNERSSRHEHSWLTNDHRTAGFDHFMPFSRVAGLMDRVLHQAMSAASPFDVLGIMPTTSSALSSAWPGVEQLARSSVVSTLPMDIAETADAYTVRVEVPGVTRDNIHMTVDADTRMLTLRVHKSIETDSGAAAAPPQTVSPSATDGKPAAESSPSPALGREPKWHRVERTYGSSTRSVRLPTDADADSISAKLSDGVLSITLKKVAVSDVGKQAQRQVEIQ